MDSPPHRTHAARGASGSSGRVAVGTMRRRSAGDIFGILFVVAGAISIVIWLGARFYSSATREQFVQIIPIVVALYVVMWMRKRLQRRWTSSRARWLS